MANLTLSDRHKRYLSQPVLPIETTADFRTHLQMFTAELDDHRGEPAKTTRVTISFDNHRYSR